MDKVKVLVVEDDLLVRKAMVALLEHLKFEVVCADNGQDALDKIPLVDPDVIVTDLHMPVMDGAEFMRRYPGPVPIVVVSGWGDIISLPRAPYALFNKPVVMNRVAPSLREAAAEYRSQVTAAVH